MRFGALEMVKWKFGMRLEDQVAWKQEHGLPHTKEEADSDLAVVGMGNGGKRNSDLRRLRDSTLPWDIFLYHRSTLSFGAYMSLHNPDLGLESGYA